MNKFRSKLLFGFITLTIVVMIALGLLLGQILKNFYLNTTNHRIEKEVNLIESVIQNENINQPLTKEKMNNFSRTLEARIIILNKEGNVIFESSSQHHKGTDHELIHEITQRHLKDDKDFYELRQENQTYYYGSPFMSKGKVEGFVILSSPVDSLKEINQQIWLILIGSFAMAIAVIILLGFQLTAHYMKPVESAAHAAMQLAKGNYRARVYEDYQDKTTMLSRSINILARNLQEITKAHEMQQDRLGTLIENMGSSLIFIDSSGHIILINRTFKEIFHVESADILHRLYYKVIPFEEINQLIETIFMTEKKVRKQILLPLSIERKFFDVYGAPVLGANDEWKGVILVFHDITELKRLEQIRKDFVANVSHELMTPITSIKGFSETLLDGALKEEETLEEFLTIILKESDRLKCLIQDLLDLSKIEQHGFTINRQTVDIIDIIQDILAMLKGKIEEKEIDLILQAKKDQQIWMLGDANRLKQIFLNLVDNAINYTPKKGKITITLTEEHHQIVIRIKDTGIGIKQEEIPRIFERFYRIDKARSRSQGGTGLGLAIVKHLVEAHQGTIFVQSEVGKGTAFIVTFLKTTKS